MDAPLIVRLAGLAADALDPFRDRAAADLVEALEAAEAELAAARQALVATLHEILPAAPAEQRRALLAFKRDAFNGRPLRSGANGCEAVITVVAVAEAQKARLARGLAAACRRLADEQRYHLAALATGPELRRGLALASPDLLNGLARLGSGGTGRKTRKLEASLARYLSRAAVKTSPYSTLTPVGLALTDPELAGPSGAGLAPGPYASRSLMRLKRFLLRQVIDVLSDFSPFRSSLRLSVNSSVEEAEGRLRFLRPAGWRWSPEGDRLLFVRDALVEVALGGPLVAELRRQQGEEGTLAERIEALRGELAPEADPDDARQQIGQALDRLIEIGFLILSPPWPANAGYFEQPLLAHLRRLGEPVAGVAAALAEIVAIEEGYVAATDPAADLRRLDAGVRNLGQAAARTVGRVHATAPGATKGTVYEDVFVISRSGGEVARLPRRDATELVALTRPLVGVLGLGRRAHELGHRVEAFAAERWPGRREIGLLEFFSAFQPLWQRLLEAEAAGAQEEACGPLAAARRRIGERVRALCSRFDEEHGAYRLDEQELAALAAEIPLRYRTPVGGVLSVQPAGELWVLNKLAEGIGRMGSRFTALMPPALARLWAEGLTARSFVEDVNGEPAELLDLMCIGGDTLNVHDVQTRRVLELPGETPALPSGRRVSLAGLRLRLTPLGPRLVDPEGRVLLPVHLGVAAHQYMPSLIKFLSGLGPGQLEGSLPSPPVREAVPGVKHYGRLLLGHLVLRRRAWRFAPAVCPTLQERSEPAAFAAVHRWRRRHGLPSRVFLYERRGEGQATRAKPQYLDLRSPLFVAILRRALEKTGERGIFLEEMLPTPELYPLGPDGRPRAAEWVIDALALAPARGEIPFPPPSPAGEGVEAEPISDPA